MKKLVSLVLILGMLISAQARTTVVSSSGTSSQGGIISAIRTFLGLTDTPDTYTGADGKVVVVNGTELEFATLASFGVGNGTVTSVGITGDNGVTVSSSPVTTNGNIGVTLGAITPLSVVSAGSVTGSNLSGTNTGDQTITLTSDVTGTGTGSFATTIATGAVTSGKILNGTILNVDVNASAAIDATKINTGVVTNTEFNYLDNVTSAIQTQLNTLSLANGTVTSIAITGDNGITIGGSPQTTNGTITTTLDNITPLTVVSSGKINGTTLNSSTLIASRAVVSSASKDFASANTTTVQVNYLSSATGTTGTSSSSLVFSASPTLVTPDLGTPSAAILTNATGYPIANLAGAGTGVLTFLATPTTANFAAAVTGETGTGKVVFSNGATLVTPALGAATYTTLSGGAVTDSALTAGRVTFAGTAGLLSDDTDLTFATDTLTATKIAATTFTSTLTMTDDQWIGLGSGAGRIEFDDQTTDEVNILNSNVGIGTTAPVYKLDSLGTGKFGANTSGERIMLSSIGSTQFGSTIYAENDSGSAQGAIRLLSTQNLSGAVSIGSAQKSNFAIQYSTNTQAYNSDPSSLTYATALVVDGTSGNVGIGDTSPDAALDVQTTINANGAVTFGSTLGVTGNSVLASTDIGGGYGSTGVTISNAGAISANNNLIVDGTATVTGNSILTSIDIGGGYGSTGVTISSAGAISANSNLIVDGTGTITGNSILTSVDIGGGAGSTGVTITSAGAVTIDGAATIGNNSTTVAINSSDWDITTTGVMTGIGTIAADGDITLTKADPALILNTTTATDTDFWLGVTEDAGTDDDDFFQIGDGTTPGTNPFLTIGTTGFVGIAYTAPQALLNFGTTTASGGITEIIRYTYTPGATYYNSISSSIGGGAGQNALRFLVTNTAGNAQTTPLILSDNLNTITGLTFFTGGNVGIGTNAASVPFEIQNTLAIQRLTSTTGTNQAYYRSTNTSGSMFAGLESSSGGSIATGGIANAAIFGHSGALPVQIMTNSTPKMTILSGGNVGIGIAAPTGILHVQQVADSTAVTSIPVALSVDSVGAAGELTASSGVQVFAAIKPTYNQTSTAAGTDLLINRTNTAIGSGAQKLIDAQVGGSTVFSVDRNGSLVVIGTDTRSDNQWVGLGAAAGRIEFDDQTIDEVNILNAHVGIGTNTPGANLPNGFAAGKILEITDTGASASTGVAMRSSSSVGLDVWQDSSTGIGYIDNRYNNNAGNIYLRTKTNGTPVNAVVVLGSGNVGLNDITPDALLDVNGTLLVSGHVTLEGVTSTAATGTGALVFATSPTLVTPALGVATATSLVSAGKINGTVLTFTSSTIASGSVFNGGNATSDATGEGIILPKATDCTGATDEGHVCWDTNDNQLSVGNGASAQTIGSGGGGGGSTAWDAIGNPSGNGDVSMAETYQQLVWNTNNVTALARTSLEIDYTNDAATDVLTQKVFKLTNNSASVKGAERFISIENNAAAGAIGAGLYIEGTSTGAVTVGVDVSDAEIVTGLALGSNDVTVNSKTLSATEFGYLDGAQAGVTSQWCPIASAANGVTLDATYCMVLVDGGNGAVTVTLPAVASNSGLEYIIKKIDSSANVITIDGNASETIDGATTKAINYQYDSYSIKTNGSAWYIK